jgi:hypothetical protein
VKLLGKTLEAITNEDIARLISDKLPESRQLEYKKELPNNADQPKKEFLADVSSLANTDGGVVVFGIEEEKDGEGKNTGVPLQIADIGDINLDETKLRLDAILREGLDPKLSGAHWELREVEGKRVLLLGIPRSLFAPHMVWFQKNGKFYARNSSGKFQMDARELRSSFLETENWEKEADNFRRERLMQIRSGELLPQLERSMCYYFLHILPLGKRNQQQFDLRTQHSIFEQVAPPGSSGYSYRPNIDGFLVFSGRENQIFTYIQYFRNGGVEISTYSPMRKKDEDSPADVYANNAEVTAINCTKQYLATAEKIGIEPPFAAFVSILGVKGGTITDKGDHMAIWDKYRFEQDDLLLPAVIIEDSMQDITKAFKHPFDMMWQAAGMEGSRYYQEDGTRKAERM